MVPARVYLTKHATHEWIAFGFQARYIERTGVRSSAAQQPYNHALSVGIDEGDKRYIIILEERQKSNMKNTEIAKSANWE